MSENRLPDYLNLPKIFRETFVSTRRASNGALLSLTLMIKKFKV